MLAAGVSVPEGERLFVYQGQEIGMVNWHPENAEMYEDVATRYYYSHHNLKASPGPGSTSSGAAPGILPGL